MAKQQVRYAGNTLFANTLWDRYDYLSLLELSKSLLHKDESYRKQYLYSFAQDAFYALMGVGMKNKMTDNFIDLSHAGEMWFDVLHTEWFPKLQEIFDRNPMGKVTATLHLAEVALSLMDKTKSPPPPLQEDPWEAMLDNQEQQQNEQGQGEEQKDEQGQKQQDQNETSGQEEQGDNVQEGQGEGQEQEQKGSSEQSSAPSPQAVQNSQQTPLGPQGVQYKSKRSQTEEAGEEDAQRADDEEQVKSGLLPYLGPDTTPVKFEEIDSLFNENRFMGHIKEFSKVLGFVKRAIQGAHRYAELSNGSLTGYKHTEWSEKLHPTDLAGIASSNPHTLARMAEGSLRKRVYEEKKALGRGPVVLLRDESGSMASDKNTQAKMLEVAMAIAFNGEKRELISIAWNHLTTRTCTYGVDDLRNHLRQFLGGGTDVLHALDKALKVTEEYVDGADLLILTDGQLASFPDSLYNDKLKEYREKNGRVWVVLIGDDSETDHVGWADGVIHLDDLQDNEKLKELLTQMNRDFIKGGEKVRV